MTRNLTDALKAVVDGFDDNPGVSDLDDEQPVHVRMTLGDWRRIKWATEDKTSNSPDWKERAVALLTAVGDLGSQDVYTDAEEYQNRVGAMQDLCGMADLVAAEALGWHRERRRPTMAEIKEAAEAMDALDEEEE